MERIQFLALFGAMLVLLGYQSIFPHGAQVRSAMKGLAVGHPLDWRRLDGHELNYDSSVANGQRLPHV